MKLRKISIIGIKKTLFFITIPFLVTSCTARGCSVRGKNECKKINKTRTAELIYWRLYEDSSVMEGIIKKFEEKNPGIRIKVIKKDYSNYYDDLKKSLGSLKERPDIVQIRNDWFVDFQENLVSADPKDWSESSKKDLFSFYEKIWKCNNPDSSYSFGDLEKSLKVVITPTEISQNFAPIVYKDTIMDGKVFGVALYIQNLGLFYNKTLFRRFGIEKVPETWEEVAEVSRKITTDINGKHPGDEGFNPTQLEYAGIAFGDSQIGINRATDILATLFMQRGINMVDSKISQATFNQSFRDISGADVLDFYTSFTDPASDNFSWDGNFGGGIGADEAFRRGKVGMIINYPHKLKNGAENYWDAINSFDPETGKKPRFDLGVAKLPAFSLNRIDLAYGSYFSEVVTSINYPYESWLFLRYLTGLDEENLEESPPWIYASNTNLPSSRTGEFLRKQIEAPHKNFTDWRDSETLDPLIKPFVEQISKSISWQKRKPIEVEKAISSMIVSVQKFKIPGLKSSDPVPASNPKKAVSAGAKCVSELLNEKNCNMSDVLI